VLVEPLDVLLVLHFILVIEGEEGLGVGIGRIPELEG
jgi:DNA-binding cell septation regulator SpoVG